MKKLIAIVGVMMFAVAALAAPDVQSVVPPLPKVLNNARFVYITSYDGNSTDAHLLPEDRQAIATVQDAMYKWGRFFVVDDPSKADIVVAVMSRPSEDVLAVYDRAGWLRSDYLWRVMARNGLKTNEVSPNDAPLVTQFEQAFENASK